MLFERPFMATALKGVLTEWLQPALSRVLGFFGLPHDMQLQSVAALASSVAPVEEDQELKAKPSTAPTAASS